jgi:hypothetical protein
MGAELTVLNNNTAIQQGGLGVDFNNPLFKLEPATLHIVQPNSTVEGGIKGHLRISETGDQFSEVWATLLTMPTEGRQYHIGERSEMNRIPENLMCFSTDTIVPHEKARVPQAMTCKSCPRADWGPWREYKEKNNGQTSKALIPACDSSYKALIVDDKYKLPLRMFIRSDNRGPFEAGMQNLARVIAMEKAKGKNPNIFDVKFKIATKLTTKGKYTYYTLVFSDFKPITDEEREQFGAVYLQYISTQARKQEAKAIAEAEAETSATNGSIDASLVEGEYVPGDDKEIPI